MRGSESITAEAWAWEKLSSVFICARGALAAASGIAIRLLNPAPLILLYHFGTTISTSVL